MKILVSDKLSEAGIGILEKSFPVDVKLKLPPEELLKIIPEYDALVVRSETKVTKEIIAAATKLKAIGRAGVGVDNIDVEAATQKGIIVMNAPDGNTVAATEHTIAMMLSLARNIPLACQSMQEGRWDRSKFMGVEMRGKTLGIVGLGRIGSGVAKRALAMDMNIIGYDPFVNEAHAAARHIKLVSLEEIWANADFITLHMPISKETKNLLNKETFAKMKKEVRIINCARGPIINEADLAEAVKSGQIAGAALDVFEKEPLDPASPLIGIPNIILTPHLGASTEEAQINVAIDVAHAIVAVLNDEPISSAVNMAPVAPQVLEVIKPYLGLGEKMGRLAMNLAEGPIVDVNVEYNGEISQLDTKMLTVDVVKGILAPLLQTSVNYVNAMPIAKDRGIKIKETKSKELTHFANQITVTVQTGKGQQLVSGALFGDEGRIVSINGHRLEIDPVSWLLILPHIDKPGMIGKLGNILGDVGINIASMQMGRTAEAGTSIVVMTVEAHVPDEIIAKIKAVDGVLGAKLVDLNAF
ncbi:MAG: phosphoglycerate dehydrogenase [Sporomusaceae bacterium]|jgi:D-3-phosphoglycerate dehydrogenase|nr:phosphoglycerate dehydrogenase [Sporomusaceae bacterium]